MIQSRTIMRNLNHRRQGQAAVEYILVVSLVIVALFTGVDQLIFASLDIYLRGISATLNLPIP